MTSVLLALVPVFLAAGSLAWCMTMGAREQAKSDAFAAQWAKDNHH